MLLSEYNREKTLTQLPPIFFEIHRDLPREGPGNFESTQRAFSLLPALPPQPHILDLGCGPGMQTLHLLQLSQGTVVAVDNHAPFLDQLSARARQTDVTDRLTTLNADMAALPFAPGSFDLIWSEGAAYSIGFETALQRWQPLLKPPGYLAVTEISWLTPNPPEAVRQFWAVEYPAMQTVTANLAIIQRLGYQLLGHFNLPAAAWWTDYYTPLAARLQQLREKYSHEPEALEVIALHEQEIELYRPYADDFGYVFYVMQMG
jgi:ubiquinone/menaquinone biosynthesis C-methylase UbiE